jgi:3-dehydrosphinganine reductase
MDFTKKLVLITGGSSGIGLAIACQMAALGADIWILARDCSRLDEAEAKIKAARRSPEQRIGNLTADVTNEKQVNDVVKLWMSEVGTPDIVINSAGIVEPGYFEDQSVKIFHDMMDVDFFGVLHVIRAVTPAMVSRQSGHIVNISSGAGFVGWYGYSAYGSAKFAVRGLSEYLRTEMKPLGIKVSVVFPFDTETPQLVYDDLHKPPETKALSELIGSPVKADAVARSIVKGIARGSFYIIPGLDIKVLYFIYSAFPGIALTILDYLVRIALKKTNSTRRKLASTKM